MHLEITTRPWARSLCLGLLLALPPVFAADTPAPSDLAPIIATEPLEIETEDGGVHGQLVVTPEILSADTHSDLVYTLTSEPRFGQVGLAGGDEADFFRNKTSRLGYFAYRAQENYVGEDVFGYTVRNETTGLVYQSTVVVTVKPLPPVVLPKYVVDATRERNPLVREVALTTRPNLPVEQKIPSHEDYLPPADRIGLAEPKVAYLLDGQAPPQHGSARLDPATGRLTYAPNPGFIGEDRFRYFTVDEANPHLGMENTIVVRVEPIRLVKHVTADRSRSREVDLVFVINNSPSMAAHQGRIAANLGRFRQLFHERDLDYRIGVLTTDFVNTDPNRPRAEQSIYKKVRSARLDPEGRPVFDKRGRPVMTTKRVASNGALVTLPVMAQPWVTPRTPDGIFAELVKVGTNGDSNRTAFTAVHNFVAGYYNKAHTFLRPDATTIVVFFMDEEETRMARWREERDGTRTAEWSQNGSLPDLIRQFNARRPKQRQTLDGYINHWVLRPFIIAKGNRRGKIEMHAVVAPANVSHRRAAELTGGTVLDIEGDFSAPLAALGDRIADTVAVALEPVDTGANFYEKSLRVLVDGEDVRPDPQDGYVYDQLTHSIRFQGAAKKKAFTAKIDITYEEHR
jgi:hypothetical protein